MPLNDLSIITFNGLSVKSENQLTDDLKTFSSNYECLTGRIIDSDVVVLGNEKDFHKKNSIDEKVFQIASITKTFSAAALVKVIVDNPDAFNIDDPLSTKISVFKDRLKPEAKSYFEKLEMDPEFHYEDITLRHVLNHSSGIANQDFFDEFRSDQNKEIRLSNQTIPLKSQNGFGKFSYCDANYNYIIEPIIEAVTGKKFADVIRDEIIKPCELEQTFMFDEMEYDKERNEVLVRGRPEIKVAQGYDYFDGKYTSTQDFNYDSAAGGVYATAYDVAKFYNQLLNERIFEDQTKQKAFDDIFFKEENFIDSDHFKYGAGIRRVEHEGKEYFLHSGSAFGFNSYVFGQRSLTTEKDVRICAAAISYENLTREIASGLINNKKRKNNGDFFVDDELNDKMNYLANSYSLEQLLEIRKEMEENSKMTKEDSWTTRISQEEQNKSNQNVR